MIIRFGRLRTTRTDSDSTTWTMRGSFSTFAARAIASARRFDGGEIHRASFGFRDDLLRDHHDVAIAQRQIRRLGGVRDQRRQIVAGTHHRQSGDRENFQARAHVIADAADRGSRRRDDISRTLQSKRWRSFGNTCSPYSFRNRD